MAEITEEMYRACKDALVIADGASNAAGASNSLVNSYRAWLHSGHGTDEANHNPAARLILEQLVYLNGGYYEDKAPEYEGERLTFDEAMEECEDIIEEYESEHSPETHPDIEEYLEDEG